jgi:ABC-2 type transport system ATP-binding protein
VIQVEHLTKRYRDIVAVDDLSFSVEKGRILGFLGPNGAGKSSTMRMITGFMPPTAGTVKVAGFDVFESPLEVKRRIGYLPEQPPVYGELTVREYLGFVASLKGVGRKGRKAEIGRVAELTRTHDVLGRRIGNLSKGYRQRVGLAQSLLGSPEVLILDEPTVGLDPSQIIEVRELIKSLGGDHTVILSTHILAEVAMVCQKVLIVNQGKMVAFDDLDTLAKAHREADRDPSLEEIFLKLTAA